MCTVRVSPGKVIAMAIAAQPARDEADATPERHHGVSYSSMTVHYPLSAMLTNRFVRSRPVVRQSGRMLLWGATLSPLHVLLEVSVRQLTGSPIRVRARSARSESEACAS